MILNVDPSADANPRADQLPEWQPHSEKRRCHHHFVRAAGTLCDGGWAAITMKRFVLWFVGIHAILFIAALLAFTLSPWPGVAVITYIFSKGDQASEAALAKHVPDGVVSRRDIAYGAGMDELLDLYYPEGAAALPTIVWVHGGGFVAGSKDGVANFLKVLTGHGYTAIAVEYSRGRGTTYPKPLEQVNAALGFVSSHAAELHVDPASIVLAGDSAGAHIASQVALIATDPAYSSAIGIPPQLKPHQLRAMLLVSGAFDPFTVDRSGPRAWFNRTVMWAYSGVESLSVDDRFKLMSVPSHVTAAFPPSYITSGNGDAFTPQAVVLARRLQELGVQTETLFFPPNREPSLPHEYQFNLDGAAGQESLSRMLAFLRDVREKGASGATSPASIRVN
jgi:acetyl esterase/lipase